MRDRDRCECIRYEVKRAATRKPNVSIRRRRNLATALRSIQEELSHRLDEADAGRLQDQPFERPQCSAVEVTMDQAVAAAPTPRVRPSRLGTPSGVRRELARLYLDARHGRVNPSAAAKFAYILTCLHKAIETEMVEQRIADLEKFVAHRNGG